MNMLTEKAGPLPVWGWGTLGAVGIGAILWYGSSPKRSNGVAIDGSNLVGTTPANVLPGDQSGGLSLVEAELQQLLSEQNVSSNVGTGTTDSGSDLASSLIEKINGVQSNVFANHGTLEQTGLGGMVGATNLSGLQGNYQQYSSSLGYSVDSNVQVLRDLVSHADPNLSHNDSIRVNNALQNAELNLRNQEGNIRNSWVTYYTSASQRLTK